MIDKNQAMAIGGFLMLGAVALVMLQLSGMDDAFLANILVKTLNSGMANNGAMPLNTIYLILGILLLPASFAFAAVYALVQEKTDRIIAASGIAMIPLSLLTIGVSLAGAAMGIGLSAAAFLMQYFSADDAKAYKELRPGRIARSAASSVMLLISVLVALAAYSTISSDASYAENGVNEIVDTIVKTTVDADTRATLESTPDGMKAISDKMKSSGLIVLLKDNYALMSAVSAFAFIQMLAIIIAPLTGAYASLLWKMSETGSSGTK